MCTFNGSDFVLEQLASIIKQKRPPDEIVICDDCSTDDTVDKIRHFDKCSDVKIKLCINDKNLGASKNFEKAIQLCCGDIIALADQDDIWLPHKLQLVERELMRDERIGAVFSNAFIVDENLEPLHYTMWDVVGISKKKIRTLHTGYIFNCVLNRFFITGATMAFRSRYKRYIIPIPPIWFHDAWISLIISSVRLIKPIMSSLILYRQHQSNQIGGKKRTLVGLLKRALNTNRVNYFQKELSRYHAAYERLHRIDGVNHQKIKTIQRKIKHLELRQNLPGNRLVRIPFVIKEFLLFGYHRYSRGPEIALQDLLFR
jgi:glycosyltransferase involved in cell wall biosynthesis